MDTFKDRPYIFIEIGAGQLIQMAKSCLGPQTHRWITSLNKKDQDDWQPITTGLAMLHEAGHKIDWEGFDQPYQRKKWACRPMSFLTSLIGTLLFIPALNLETKGRSPVSGSPSWKNTSTPSTIKAGHSTVI